MASLSPWGPTAADLYVMKLHEDAIHNNHSDQSRMRHLRPGFAGCDVACQPRAALLQQRPYQERAMDFGALAVAGAGEYWEQDRSAQQRWHCEGWLELRGGTFARCFRHRDFVTALANAEHDARRWCDAFRDAGDGTASPDMAAIRGLRVLIWLQTVNVVQATPHAGAAIETDIIRLSRGVCWQNRAPDAVLRVRVLDRDMLEVAGELVAQGCSVAVLNMACARHPGGGVARGVGAQEENLYRRSDMLRLTKEKQRLYPLRQDSCLLSRGVQILRGSEAEGYPFLAKSFSVSVISCAAVFRPKLTYWKEYRSKYEYGAMEHKVALIVQAACEAGCDVVVLSAFGCGAYGNPPVHVARMFHNAFRLSSIRHVTFCILDDHNAGRAHNPEGNLRPFRQEFRKAWPEEQARGDDPPSERQGPEAETLLGCDEFSEWHVVQHRSRQCEASKAVLSGCWEGGGGQGWPGGRGWLEQGDGSRVW